MNLCDLLIRLGVHHVIIINIVFYIAVMWYTMDGIGYEPVWRGWLQLGASYHTGTGGSLVN